MPNKDKRRDLYAYRQRVRSERRKAERSPIPVACSLCGQPIDMTLPYNHKMAWTLEHVKAIAAGGHIMGRTVPAHRSCNSKKGDGTRNSHLQASVPKWF